MMFKRLNEVERGLPIIIFIDGEPVNAFSGETLATAILTAGKDIMRKTILSGNSRGYYCGMGVCCECIVELEDGRRVKACQTVVEKGMKVKIPQQSRQEE
jgi:D-hydroxyproline dehydrogenase subunit gamma